MSSRCCAPDCTNLATTGPLCYVCEGLWMRERAGVVESAEHVAVRAAEFSAWCQTHNQPNPYD